jgi:WD40 repeat protein
MNIYGTVLLLVGGVVSLTTVTIASTEQRERAAAERRATAHNIVGGTLTVEQAGGIAVYDLDTGKLLRRFHGENPYVTPALETIFTVKQGLLEAAAVVVSPDGSQRSVVGKHSMLPEPILSPDGSLVAVRESVQGFGNGALIYRRSDGRPLHHFSGVHPADWTPDGRLVATCEAPLEAQPYMSNPTEMWLCISDREFREMIPINKTLSGRDPTASPDGKHLAYVHDGEIWVVGIDGTAPRQLTNVGLDVENGEPRAPVWSPDGRYLAVRGVHGFVRNNEAYMVHYMYLISAERDGQKLEARLIDADGRPIAARGRASWR